MTRWWRGIAGVIRIPLVRRVRCIAAVMSTDRRRRVHPVVRLGSPAVYGWKSSEEQRGAIEEGWARVVGVERDVVIESVEFDEEAGEVVASCRLRRGYARVYIEADAPRVSCPSTG